MKKGKELSTPKSLGLSFPSECALLLLLRSLFVFQDRTIQMRKSSSAREGQGSEREKNSKIIHLWPGGRGRKRRGRGQGGASLCYLLAPGLLGVASDLPSHARRQNCENCRSQAAGEGPASPRSASRFAPANSSHGPRPCSSQGRAPPVPRPRSSRGRAHQHTAAVGDSLRAEISLPQASVRIALSNHRKGEHLNP